LGRRLLLDHPDHHPAVLLLRRRELGRLWLRVQQRLRQWLRLRLWLQRRLLLSTGATHRGAGPLGPALSAF